ncbi:MAG: hypothetical protein Q6363_001365 [Candidatus Njordarchaeota archaeon]
MRNIVVLYEAGFPGVLLGKKVVTKEAETIGVCSGVLLDLDNKEVSIMVSAQDLLLRIKLSDILAVNEKEILIEKKQMVLIRNRSEIDNEIKDLREEIGLIGKLMYIEAKLDNKKKSRMVENIDIAKLFHLI